MYSYEKLMTIQKWQAHSFRETNYALLFGKYSYMRKMLSIQKSFPLQVIIFLPCNPFKFILISNKIAMALVFQNVLYKKPAKKKIDYRVKLYLRSCLEIQGKYFYSGSVFVFFFYFFHALFCAQAFVILPEMSVSRYCGLLKRMRSKEKNGEK